MRKHRGFRYHPIQKVKILLKGLQIAVISDFSVAYKLVLSVPTLILSVVSHQWVDVTLVLLATPHPLPLTSK